MAEALEVVRRAFEACTTWLTQLVTATGSLNVILAAFSIVLIVGLLFIPMRGGSLVSNFDTFADFNAGVIHRKGRYQSGGMRFGRSSKGRFAQGNSNAYKTVRRGKRREYKTFKG